MVIDKRHVDVSRKYYGLSHTLPSNIQLPSIDHYFTHVFGEQNLVMFLVLINYIAKTLQWLTKGKWMFEKNDAVFPSIAFKHPRTIYWSLFQTCICLLTFCYPIIVLLPWQLGVPRQFGHQLQITFKHPTTLGEVLQLGYISHSIVLIWKVV
jgi:hypothetical protein